MYNGAAVATLVMDAAGALVTQPQVTVMGLIGDPRPVRSWSKSVLPCGKRLRSCRCNPGLTTRRCGRLPGLRVRRSFNASQGKKPLTEVHLVRLWCSLTGDVDR